MHNPILRRLCSSDEMDYAFDWSERTGGHISYVYIRQYRRHDGTQYWLVSFRHFGVLRFLWDRESLRSYPVYPTALQAIRAANRELAWAVVC